MARVRYTAFYPGPWFIVAVLAIMGAVAIFLIATAVPGAMPELRSGRPPLFFVFAWLAVLAWNAYIWLFRFAWQLELSGDVLTWRTPFRYGEVIAADIREVGPSPLSQQISVITSASRPKIYALTQSGFTQFAQELLRVAPSARYRENSYAIRRARHTRQWASGFRRFDD